MHFTRAAVLAISLALLTGPAAGDLSWDPGNDGLGGVGDWNTTNIDWDVDAADYQAFVSAFGSDGDRHTDFNEDGRVDLIDLAILRANFGTGVELGAPGDAGASTPEPATMTVLALGGLLVLRGRRKR